MTAMTRMAFRFMADNVRRDAAAYNEKCSNYRAAAQRRWEDEKYRARFEAAGGSDRKGNGGWNRPSAEPASPDNCLTFYMQQLRRRRQEQRQESAPASAPVD